MIIGRTRKDIQNRREQEEKVREKWHKVFIIWPRQLEDGRLVFLQYVERRSYWMEYYGHWINEYREIQQKQKLPYPLKNKI